MAQSYLTLSVHMTINGKGCVTGCALHGTCYLILSVHMTTNGKGCVTGCALHGTVLSYTIGAYDYKW